MGAINKNKAEIHKIIDYLNKLHDDDKKRVMTQLNYINELTEGNRYYFIKNKDIYYVDPGHGSLLVAASDSISKDIAYKLATASREEVEKLDSNAKFVKLKKESEREAVERDVEREVEKLRKLLDEWAVVPLNLLNNELNDYEKIELAAAVIASRNEAVLRELKLKLKLTDEEEWRFKFLAYEEFPYRPWRKSKKVYFSRYCFNPRVYFNKKMLNAEIYSVDKWFAVYNIKNVKFESLDSRIYSTPARRAQLVVNVEELEAVSTRVLKNALVKHVENAATLSKAAGMWQVLALALSYSDFIVKPSYSDFLHVVYDFYNAFTFLKLFKKNVYFHFYITLLSENLLAVKRLINFSALQHDIPPQSLVRVSSVRKLGVEYFRINFVVDISETRRFYEIAKKVDDANYAEFDFKKARLLLLETTNIEDNYKSMHAQTCELVRQLLENRNIKYVYNKKQEDSDSRPDFYLPDLNTALEVETGARWGRELKRHFEKLAERYPLVIIITTETREGKVTARYAKTLASIDNIIITHWTRAAEVIDTILLGGFPHNQPRNKQD